MREKNTPWFPGGLLLDLEQLLNRKVDIAERRYVERTHSRARFAGSCTTMRREAQRLQDIAVLKRGEVCPMPTEAYARCPRRPMPDALCPMHVGTCY